MGDAVIGDLFSAYLTEEVFDSDHDVNDLTFRLLSGPNWLSIDSQGQLIGRQSSKEVGAHEVMLRVSDPDDLIAIQIFQSTSM